MATALLVSCSKGKSDADIKPKVETFSPVAVHSVTYHCDNNSDILAQLATGKLRLRLTQDLVLGLKRQPSETGLKYAFENYVFSINGHNATLTLPGNRPLHCRQQAGDSQ